MIAGKKKIFINLNNYKETHRDSSIIKTNKKLEAVKCWLPRGAVLQNDYKNTLFSSPHRIIDIR